MAKPTLKNSADGNSVKPETAGASAPATVAPRKIPGNLPYLTSSGTLKKVLDRIKEASRPDKFNTDFLENVLKLTGGSARAIPPVMKKMGFLGGDGSPTELYGKFRTEGGRGQAALQGLRNAFPEIFKRSEYAHSVDDAKLRDIIVEITGLKANDPVATAIKATFNVIKSYIPANIDLNNYSDDAHSSDDGGVEGNNSMNNESGNFNGIGLTYNINIVLPETSDLKVFNAIFRSIKENLMK